MRNKTGRKRGEGSIIQVKDGRYRLRIVSGTKMITDKETGLPKKIKNTKDFYGHSEKEVVAKYEEWKEKQELNSPSGYQDRLLMECVFEWLHNVKEGSVKASSFARLIQVAEDNVLPRLSTYKIEEVTTEVIQNELINHLRKQGYSYSTIKKAVNILTGFYRWAVGTGKVTFNPTTALVMPSEKVLKEAKGQTDEVKYYSKSEIKRMQETADMVNMSCYEVGNYRFPRAYTYLFIIHTGLRIGEMLALRWDDFDEEKKTITVHRDIVEYKDPQTKKIITKEQLTPKTSSSRRTLVLSDEAIALLNTIKERTFNPRNKYIVSNRNKKGQKEYVAPSNFRNAFRRFCEQAGVEYKGVHALRHTFATMMFAQGVDVKYISEWLGHSSVQVTYDIYIHIMEEYGYENKTTIPAIKI